jgi:hypothetical protein
MKPKIFLFSTIDLAVLHGFGRYETEGCTKVSPEGTVISQIPSIFEYSSINLASTLK